MVNPVHHTTSGKERAELDLIQDLVGMMQTFLNYKVQEEYQRTLIMELKDFPQVEAKADPEDLQNMERLAIPLTFTKRTSTPASEEVSVVELEVEVEALEIHTTYHINKIIRASKEV